MHSESPSLGANDISALLERAHSLLHRSPNESLTCAQEAYRAAQALEQPDLIALASLELAEVLVYFSDTAQAESLLRNALDIFTDLTDEAGKAKTISLFGFAAYRRGDFEASLAFRKESLLLFETLHRDADHHEGIADASRGVGSALQMLGRYHEALSFYQRALDALPKNDAEKRASILNSIGNTFEKLGDFHTAQQKYESALELATATDNTRLLAYLQANMGIIANRLGDFQKSLRHEKDALRLKIELGDKLSESISYNNIAVIYENLSDFPASLEYHFKSLTLTRAIQDKQGESVSLNNIGNIYERLGNAAKALTFFEDSLALAQSMHHEQGAAYSLYRIGLVRHKEHVFDLASDAFHAALAISQKTKDRYLECGIISAIGTLHAATKNSTEVESYFKRALAISREISDKQGETHLLLKLGDHALSQGEPQDSLDFLYQALRFAGEMNARELVIEALLKLHATYHALQIQSRADEMTKLAQEISHQIFNTDIQRRLQKMIAGFESERIESELTFLSSSPRVDASFLTPPSQPVPNTIQISPPPTVQQLHETLMKQTALKTTAASANESLVVIKTFGVFSLHINNTALDAAAWQRRKARDVFKYLLLHYQKAVSADELLDLFWDGKSDKSALDALKVTIHRIRHAIQADALKTQDRSYTLAFPRTATIDFLIFEEHIASARYAAADKRQQCYADAVAIYNGEFLKENLYDSWTDARRTALHQSFVHALRELSASHLEQKRYDPAIQYASRLIETDELDEFGYAILIRAHLAVGQPLAAQTIFERCRTTYQRELHTAPPLSLSRLLSP
jgi:DNA-binding SARP family transcriptional activator